MSENCLCGVGLSNLGTPECTKQMGRPYKFIFVNTKDSSGDFNKVASGDTVDQSYIDALVSNLDVTKRWFVSPEVKNFISTKGDQVFQTFDDDTRTPLREGLRTFEGMFNEADSSFLKDLESVKCSKASFFLITDEGNLIGYSKDSSGDVYPITIDLLVTKLNFKTGDANQNVMFTLDIPLNILDSEISTVYDIDADLVGAEGLVQLKSSVSTPVALGYTIQLNNGGAYGSTIGYKGLEIADLVAYNVTTDTSATVASVTATATAGAFELTFTGAVATDIVRVSEGQDLLDAGFSFPSVELAVA